MIKAEDIKVDHVSEPDGGVRVRSILVFRNESRLSANFVCLGKRSREAVIEDAKQQLRREILHSVYGELRDDFYSMLREIRVTVEPRNMDAIRKHSDAILGKLTF